MTKENEEAIEVLKSELDWAEQNRYPYISENKVKAIKLAIKTLKQGDVLEKIRAEILDEAEYAYADFDRYKEDILYAEPDELPNDDFRYGMERAVEIINKYRKGGAK